MATTVGEIAIDIRARMEKLQADVTEGKAIVKGGMSDIQAAATAMQATIAAIGGMAIVGFIESVIESAAQLKQMSEQAGVSVESLSALRSVAKLSGTDMNDVVGSLQKLSKSMVAAKDPTSAQADMFKQLGISVFNSSGKMKTADQVMLEMAVSMDKYKDGTEKTVGMQTLLGKSGANLLPLYKDLAEKGNLNGKVTTEQSEAADNFQKTLIKLNAQMQGLLRGALLPLLPYLTTLGPLFEAAAKLAVAYFAVFIAAPAIITAATAALGAFQMMQVQAALATMGGVSALQMFGFAMVDSVAATKAAVLSMGILKSAALLAMAAYAGWEFGSWLRENFVEAQLAGIAFVDGMLVGWESLKYGAQVAWLGIKTAFNTAISAIGEVFATELEFIAKGMALVGAGSAADGIKNFASSIRSATANTSDFKTEQAKLKSQYDENVKAVRTITGDMADEAIALDQSKRLTKANSDAKADLSIKNKDVADASDKMAKKILEVTGKLNDELAMLKLSNVEAEIYKQLKAAGVTANSAAGQEIARLVTTLATEKDMLKLTKDAKESYTKAIKDHDDALNKETATLLTKLEKAKEENAQFGLSKSGIEALTLTRLNERREMYEGWIAKGINIEWAKKELAAVQDQIDIQTEYVGELQKGEAATAQKKNAEDSLKAWQDVAKDMEKALTDSLMRGFESGKNMVDSIRDYITNAFKSMVVKLAVQPIMGGITSIIGGLTGNSAMAADGASKTAGGMSNIMSTISTISTMASAFGSSIAAGFSATIASFGATTGLAIEGGMASIAAGTSASIAAGLGQIIGTLGPYALAAVTVYGLLGGFKGTYVQGKNVTSEYDAQGNRTSRGVRQWANVSDGGQAFDDFLGGIVNTYQSLAKGLNIKTGRLGLGFETNDSEGGKYGFNAALNGQNVLSVGETKITDGAIALTASRAVFAALQASEMPQYLAGIFDGMTASAMTQEQLNAALQTAQAYQALHTTLTSLPLANLRDLSYQAASGLVAAAGGMDTLIKGLQSYYDLYYSEAEKNSVSATAISSALAAVGIDGSSLTTRQDFRTLFESIDATTASGQQQIAALLQIAPQFATLADYLTTQGKDLGDLVSIAPTITALADTTAAATTAATTAADATTAAIATTTTAVESGTTAVVGAVTALSTTVSAAVTTASAASTAAIAALTARLDALDSSNRLQGAAP